MRRREGLVPVGLGGAGPLVGFVPCLPDGGVPVGFGGGDPRGGVLAGRLGRRRPGRPRRGAGRLGLVGALLGGGQLGGHLLGRGVGFRAPLVCLGGPLLGGGGPGLGGGGALLGRGAGGFDLGLGGGRVGQGRDGVAEPPGDARHPVGFGAQQAQQFRAGYPGVRHRLVGVGRAGRGSGRGGGQAAAFPPRGDLGVAAAFAVLRGPAWPGGRGDGLRAAGVVAGGTVRGRTWLSVIRSSGCQRAGRAGRFLARGWA